MTITAPQRRMTSDNDQPEASQATPEDNSDVKEANAQEESFKEMFEHSLRQQPVLRRGQVVKGVVVSRDNESLIIDIGAKAEGVVSLSEFAALEVEVPGAGEEIEVLVKTTGGKGGVKLSVVEARRIAVWKQIELAQKDDRKLTATVIAEIKGGYRVDLGGLFAFMPKSEADMDPRYPAKELMGKTCEVMVLDAERKPENVVVSRKKPIARDLERKRQTFFAGAKVGDKINGKVRRLASFGAFVDIGGVDALLHVSDISWRHLNHPREMLNIGQNITAEIIKLDPEEGKVSVSMRALQPDPWQYVPEKYEAGMRLTGTVHRLLDYGAMVELEPGVEGMIHRSELSWTRKEVKPTSLLAEGDVVDVAVLAVETDKRRISLSLKEVMENPWHAWLADHPVGSKVTGPVKNITSFGLFIGLDEELDGLVHIGNLSWSKPDEEAIAGYKKDQKIECMVLGVDVDRQRISLGIKQLSEDPFEVFLAGAGRGTRVHGKVTEARPNGFTVELATGIQAWLSRRELPRDHEGFEPGCDVEGKIIDINRKRRQLTLSVRQLLLDDERDAVRNYTDRTQDNHEPSALALELQRKLLAKSEGAGKRKKTVSGQKKEKSK